MKIAVCGSIEFAGDMASVARDLEQRGYEADYPAAIDEGIDDNDPVVRRELMRDYFERINRSDAVLLYNVAKHGIAGYVGGNTLLEAGHAFASGLEVFMFNDLPDMPYRPEIAGMNPIVINGDVAAIDAYYDTLPRLHVSSENTIKLRAFGRALRRAGRPTTPIGHKTTSGVNEQPLSVEETYRGATNRHAHLYDLVSEPRVGDYFATIESGNDTFHRALGLTGCSWTIIEQIGGDKREGLDVDIPFPDALASLVPSKYPDFGVLVKELYGSALKDPYPYITNGQVERLGLLEQGAWRVAVQLAPLDR